MLVVVVVVVVELGQMMIDECGGPWPVPSCATAAVVTADVTTRRLRITSFIFILLVISGMRRRRRERVIGRKWPPEWRVRDGAPHK